MQNNLYATICANLQRSGQHGAPRRRRCRCPWSVPDKIRVVISVVSTDCPGPSLLLLLLLFFICSGTYTYTFIKHKPLDHKQTLHLTLWREES